MGDSGGAPFSFVLRGVACRVVLRVPGMHRSKSYEGGAPFNVCFDVSVTTKRNQVYVDVSTADENSCTNITIAISQMDYPTDMFTAVSVVEKAVGASIQEVAQ